MLVFVFEHGTVLRLIDTSIAIELMSKYDETQGKLTRQYIFYRTGKIF